MKNLFMFSVLLCSLTANAGFKLLSNEDVVSFVLNSEDLKTEKQSIGVGNLPLKSINIEYEGMINIYLTYSDGGAPCSVKATVTTYNSVPEGAYGSKT